MASRSASNTMPADANRAKNCAVMIQKADFIASTLAAIIILVQLQMIVDNTFKGSGDRPITFNFA